MKTNSLENLRLEKLGKIANSCAKAQSLSLSKMLNNEVRYDLRRISQMEFYKVEKMITKFVKQQVCAAYVRCEGGIRLEFLFFLSIEEAKRLVTHLQKDKFGKDFTSIKRSSIAEIGNIMAGTFLNILSGKTGIYMQPSVPGFAMDSFEAVVGTPLADITSTTDEVVVIETEFRSSKDHLVIHSITMLEPEGVRKIIQKSSDMM